MTLNKKSNFKMKLDFLFIFYFMVILKLIYIILEIEKSARGRGAFLKIRRNCKGGGNLYSLNCDDNSMGGLNCHLPSSLSFWGDESRLRKSLCHNRGIKVLNTLGENYKERV